MSWVVELQIHGQWVPNDRVFTTGAEADQWGSMLVIQWVLPTAYRVTSIRIPTTE